MSILPTSLHFSISLYEIYPKTNLSQKFRDLIVKRLEKARVAVITEQQP